MRIAMIEKWRLHFELADSAASGVINHVATSATL